MLHVESDFYNIVLKIDQLSSNYTKANLKEIESYFAYNNLIKEYFIRRISGLIDADFDSDPWFKPLYEKGYFSPEDNPKSYISSDKTVITSYWNVLSILDNIAEKNEGKLNEKIDIIVKILDDFIIYNDRNDMDSQNSLTNSMFIRIISCLPEEKIKEKYFNFIRTSLKQSKDSFTSREINESVFPKFIKSKELTLRLLDVIFDSKKSGYKYFSIMDNYWFNDSLKRYKKDIFNICGIEALNVAIAKIKSITKIEPWQFNIATIEKHPQSTFTDGFNYQLIYFIRDLLESLNSTKIRNTVKSLIQEENPIFKRIAIHTINYYYKDLNDLFWNLENPLNVYGLRHEIFVLLESNFKEFNDNQYGILINWIKDIDTEKTESLDAYEKLRWIYAVKKSENLKINQLYRHYQAIYPDKINHPDFGSWHGEIRTSKPVNTIKLSGKSNKEIAEYLINEEKDVAIFPDEGTYESFELCVYENPVKFSKNLAPFLNVSRKAQNDLLSGLFQSWSDGNNFEWFNILTFIWTVINSESFWKEYPLKGFSYYNEIIYSILFLIEDRSKDDKRNFDKNLLQITCEILVILSEKISYKFDGTSNDIVLDVLNTPRGRLFHTMINFSLSYARLYKNEEDKKWLTPIKSNFENKLKNKPPIELPVVLGQLLPQIFYLDKEWTKENIELIFSSNNWENAFSGYLFTSNKIYGAIYDLFKNKEYYDRALRTDFANNEVNESLVNHICIAFIFDREKLEDKNSLIIKLINNKNINKLKEIIRFFLMQKKENYELAKEKSNELWKYIFNIVFQDPEYYKEFIAEIPSWIISFDEHQELINDDEIFDYFLTSLKYISQHNYDIIPYLFSFLNKSPKDVSKIFIEMINNETAPKYRYHDEIKAIVQVLYDKDLREEANKISNYYGEKGDYFLKDLYIKHN